ncbi:MAG: hypothetical protein ABFD92_07850 [Planctomycetaceae bacterium]|nr:hypothetical protein [Planctomycetaceae bacterium]
MDIKQAKAMFFDPKKVIDAAERATQKVLSKFGAFVRQTARGSIRSGKKPAAPGRPPHSHTGLLKRFIFFGYDRQRKSVVIGPAKLNARSSDTAPEALEYGGDTKVIAGSRRRGRVVKKVSIESRPFMGPAFAKEQPKLPAMWRDSVK